MSITAFGFGKAIEFMKMGKRLSRQGWSGSNMFVYYVPAGKYNAQTEAIKDLFPSNTIPYRAYYALKTAQNDVACWTPSISDTLANDWFIVTEEQAKDWCKHKYVKNQ